MTNDGREERDGRDRDVATTFVGVVRSAVGQSAAGEPMARHLLAQGPDSDVLRFSARQPEHNLTPGAYVQQRLTATRIATGRTHRDDPAMAGRLKPIAEMFGVPADLLIAIWGLETNYGAVLGGFDSARALATLAAGAPHRRAFWQQELATLVDVIGSGRLAADQAVGSWAGAIGHMQFMPSALAAHGCDVDGDGQVNVRTSWPDAMASAACFLKRSGASDTRWGWPVVDDGAFDWTSWQPDQWAPARAWASCGLAVVEDPPDNAPLRLIAPEGAPGPLFLVSATFDAILTYNRSVPYALSVGLLSDAISGRREPGIVWRDPDHGLSRGERVELQQRLVALGYDTGGVDGILGRASRAAVRCEQQRLELTADGVADRALLMRLRDD